MGLLVRLIMQEKGMCLKNNKYNFFVLVIVFFLSHNSLGLELSNNKIINYLNALENFSVEFIQDNLGEISEGKISIGKKRVRVDYYSPSKILIILDKDKAMYYNYDLDEDEFFNPKDTSAWFFFEIFNNPIFFLDSDITLEDNNIILIKDGVNNEVYYKLSLFFENNPFIIRKINLEYNNENLTLSVHNHTFDEEFSEEHFKLINPIFFN